jgi:hypothetical protein
MTKKPPSSASAPAAGFGGKTFYADAQKNADAIAKAETTAKKRAAELLAIKRKQQALEAKTLKDKRIGNLIDKANIALGKSEEVFDMDKIQIAAALTSQAEQLGKATNASQVLQIANDTARLNVKQSILALEDAIASKDEASIVAATNKLNTDLKVLGTLGAQNLKLLDIKSLLESLKPKDLINIANLEQALDLLTKMSSAATTQSTAASVLAKPANALEATVKLSNGVPLTAEELKLLGMSGQSPKHDVPSSASAGDYLSSGFPGAATNDPTTVNITVNTGIGDPNAIAEAIDQVLTDARQRGTLREATFAA